jgi:PAS domain S-box-containing protein
MRKSSSKRNISPRSGRSVVARNILKSTSTDKELKIKADILDHINDSILVVSKAGKIYWVNSVACKELGYSREKMMTMNLRQILSPDEVKLIRSNMREIIKNGHAKFDSVYLRKDGKTIPIEVHARLFMIGKKQYVHSICRNISERKKSEEKLRAYHDSLERQVHERTAELELATKTAERSNHAKAVFISKMSHEIRTPLNAVLGYAQLLLRDPTIVNLHRKYIEVISRGGEHLLGLINEILEMSKIEAGKMEAITERFDLCSLLADTEMLFKEKAEEKNLKLVINLPSDLPRIIESDGNKVRQIVINLLGNAFKFTEQGSITVNVTDSPVPKSGDKRLFKIEISDTGAGINPTDAKKLFQAFEQATAGKYQTGTGLGLSISKQYAHLLGGDVVLSKSVPGKGSTFTATFIAKVISSKKVKEEFRDSGRKVIGIVRRQFIPKILIVDDADSNREFLRVLLLQVGFDVKDAATGKEALGILKEWQPDLILLDRIMPDLDGIEICKKIRATLAQSKIKIIMVTASALEDSRREVSQCGIDGFVSKPFRESEIFAAIKRVLNIEYLYANEPSPVRASLAHEAAQVLLEKISTEVVSKIIEASEVGDVELLHKLIDESVTPSCSELGIELTNLANSYKYNSIKKLLERRKGY